MTSLDSDSVKWLIPDPPLSLTSNARAAYWEEVHAASDYENVYSLTDDAVLRDRLVQDLVARDARTILIPGCGSRVALQADIIHQMPDAIVTCVDYPGVVSMAARRFDHQRVRYVGQDVTQLRTEGSFDAVVHVTSVVSESDADNRAIMRVTSRALRTGGLMLGVFPTIYATLDIAYTTGEIWRARNVLLETSSYEEPKQRVRQIFYTPLRLRRIIREAGLDELSIYLFFNDSDYLRGEALRHYGLDDEDAVLYHLYLSAVRAGPLPSQPVTTAPAGPPAAGPLTCA